MITSVPGRVCPTCDGNGLLGPGVPCNVCQGSGVVPVVAATPEPRTDADLDAVYDLERCLRKLEEYPASKWVAASPHNVAAAGCRRALRAEADCKRLQDELATERVVLRRTADALEEFADSTHRQELTAALAAALRKRLAEQRPC